MWICIYKCDTKTYMKNKRRSMRLLFIVCAQKHTHYTHICSHNNFRIDHYATYPYMRVYTQIIKFMCDIKHTRHLNQLMGPNQLMI